MSRSVAVLTHERAGRVELDSLGLRVSEPTAGEAAAAPGGLDERGFAIGPLRFGEIELESVLETQGSTARIQLRAHNRGERAVRLDAAVLSLRWSGHGMGEARYLRHGWQSWSFTGSRALDAAGPAPFESGPWLRGFHHALGAGPADRAGWHESDLVSVIAGSGGGPALLLGVYERGVSFGVVYARMQDGLVQAAVELCAETELAPGESLVLETLRIELGTDPSGLLEDYALDYGRRAEARVARPFVSGWCSWYHAFHDVTEDDVRRNLDALVAARDELPVEVVQLDDGYQRAVGDWRETNTRFARGLAPLAEEIRAAGFVPGLWTAPFCAVSESELFAKHPDWLLQQEGAPFRAMHHPQWSGDGRVFALDTSRDEVTGHLRALFADLVAMGFGYLKLDFLFVAAMAAGARQAGLGRAARLRRGIAAVRAGAGDEVFLLGCGAPLGAAVGLVDGMRVGPDVAPHWWSDPATRIPDVEPTQPSTRSALRNVLARAWMHRRLWQNDPDCLLVRSEDTELLRGEREAFAAAVAATGGTCVVSDDVSRLAPEDRDLLRRALAAAAAVDHDGIPGAARVPDLLDAEIPMRVCARDGAGGVLALLNPTEEPLSQAVPAGAGRIGPEAKAGRLELPPHAGALLRPAREVALAVFCDFDGTFSVQDVGATLAEIHAADRRPAQWARYEAGELTPWQYNLEILEGLPVPVDELDRFLRSIDLDPGARELLAWCASADVPFRVLSDGFDWNLNRLQVLHQVRFGYAANQLRVEGGRWRIRAGFPNPACGCGTGTCKAGIIEGFRRDHPRATLVHIGNGRVSDTCGAIAADAAFAKDSLAVELERRGEPFTKFETLRDVVPGLDALLAKRGGRDVPQDEG